VNLTIGIPTYNRSQKLINLFKNLENQKFQNFKIIVSDNCSSDNTEEICKNYKKKFKDFKYIKQPKTINVLENYKYLFNNCDSKYFMWLPDDDYIDNNYIKNCYEFLINNNDYVLVSGQCHYYQNKKFMFKGNQININDEDINSRVYNYYSQARDNGNFYGIYDKEKILNYIYPKKYCGDLLFLANVIIFGKFKCLSSTVIYRDLGGGTSGSLNSIIKNLNLSKWHLYFFHFISAYDIYKNSKTIKNLYKNKLKFNFFFNIKSSYSYLKKNFVESIYHLVKVLIFK